MSAATSIEATMVIEARLGRDGADELDLGIHEAAVVLVDVDHEQAEIARRVRHRWGKGHHPAALNYGDCFSYALVVQRGEPLLFKGDDFSRSDLPAACGRPRDREGRFVAVPSRMEGRRTSSSQGIRLARFQLSSAGTGPTRR